MACRRVRVIVGVLLVLACTVETGVLASGATATLYLPAISLCPAPTATPDPNALIEQRIGDLINEARAAHGLPPLARVDELALAARRHSADMASHGFFDHVGSDGSTPGERIEQAGYPWRACGENIAAGYLTPEDVVGAWMASEAHSEAILSDVYLDMGAGYAYDAASPYDHYYTVDLATRRDP
jgi:uncharacterized protein YkwD